MAGICLEQLLTITLQGQVFDTDIVSLPLEESALVKFVIGLGLDIQICSVVPMLALGAITKFH